MSMLSKFIGVFERSVLRALRFRNKFPPLFIVGPPRCGTTLIYLYVVNTFKFAYFPNISKSHSNACVSCGAFGKIFYKYEPSYESWHGIVDGIMAPSDGWDIFHRWFPRYDYSQDVCVAHLYELKNIIRLFEIIFRAPFANKNNSNSVRIEYLNELFPDALFLHVKRDIKDATTSLLEARKIRKVALNEWVGVAPPQFFDRRFSSELEQVVYQICGVNTYIQRSLEKIPSNRWCTISYEKFCEEPTEVERWVNSKYAEAGFNLERKTIMEIPRFQARSRPSTRGVGTDERITEILDRMQTEDVKVER